MYAAILLVIAIAIEVVSTALLPRADGFRNIPWSATVLAGYGLSIWLLALVVERMPVSVAYAIWSGLGTALVAAIGVMFLGDHLSLAKAGFLAMIVVGVVGLNLSGAH
ncbi:small multidrug resistance pump [Nocardioides albertanoniae]|uniref:Small multidrug resistance pump n=1 Tax=Nocardioides albertanoniae TaxID=1175486 RepID=A0A543AB58_9ACTN|nr:multidrug efflux SMR transporter [Nocardioides albertanoniae]TQL69750.1 small multidrug resistance pump [Nocardioides albertanoniae]